MLKFNTGGFQIHPNTQSSNTSEIIHLIPEGLDAALCETRFFRKFFIAYRNLYRIIPTGNYVTSEEALRSKKYCSLCTSKLASIIRYERTSSFARFLQSHSVSPKIIPANKAAWTETICPECGSTVGFWNFCTVCNKIVKLPQEVVA